jgi:Ca2+/Na+ antiporter
MVLILTLFFSRIFKDAKARFDSGFSVFRALSRVLRYYLFLFHLTKSQKQQSQVDCSYNTSKNKMTNVSSLVALKATVSILILIVLIATKLSFRSEVSLVEIQRGRQRC